MKIVLFDVDGTLLWTDGAGRRAVHRALKDVLGIDRPAAGFRFDGRTDPEIVELLAAAAGRDHGAAVVAGVLAHYVGLLNDELSRPGHRTTVYPGVFDLVEKLVGIAVESTYNWYWMVDWLMEKGYQVHLANPDPTN